MGIFDKLRNWFLSPLLEQQRAKNPMIQIMERNRAYRLGNQARQMRVKLNQPDDNITVNFVRLIVERSVSHLLGDGVEFDLGLDETAPEAVYLENVWNANKQEILLFRSALNAADAGTGYIKLVPEGITGKDGKPTLRLIALDPSWITLETDPEDWERVTAYVIQFAIMRGDKQIMRMQRIEHPTPDANTWITRDFEASGETSNRWTMTGESPWEYDFPPIVHWQNLPSANSPYGQPDLSDDAIELQDRINFSAGNISKILRFHAHPKTIFRGISAAQFKDGNAQSGPDDALYLPAPDMDIRNLEMQSDLSAAREYLRFLRQALFDIARSVDLDSIQDKLGSLTNFGLHVLYQDALSKINTKRQLMGDALIELNRRILVMGGYAVSDGGEVIWPDFLPENQVEEMNALQGDLSMGVVSRQTVSRLRGYEWEDEQAYIADEKTAEGNIGAALLEGFSTGNLTGGRNAE